MRAEKRMCCLFGCKCFASHASCLCHPCSPFLVPLVIFLDTSRSPDSTLDGLMLWFSPIVAFGLLSLCARVQNPYFSRFPLFLSLPHARRDSLLLSILTLTFLSLFIYLPHVVRASLLLFFVWLTSSYSFPPVRCAYLLLSLTLARCASLSFFLPHLSVVFLSPCLFSRLPAFFYHLPLYGLTLGRHPFFLSHLFVVLTSPCLISPFVFTLSLALAFLLCFYLLVSSPDYRLASLFFSLSCRCTSLLVWSHACTWSAPFLSFPPFCCISLLVLCCPWCTYTRSFSPTFLLCFSLLISHHPFASLSLS